MTRSVHGIYRRVQPVFRRRRMRLFVERMLAGRGPLRILDVGGEESFWTESGIDSNAITLLNVRARRTRRHFFVQGDACAMPFADRTFDIVFSNSAIEHVSTWQRQMAFAGEIRRVGRGFWVQTPAREFFIEPHLMAPVIHWLPRHAQRRLIRNFTLWGWLTRPDEAQVNAFLEEVRLLAAPEISRLFPDGEILRERMGGLTKSYIAIRPPS